MKKIGFIYNKLIIVTPKKQVVHAIGTTIMKCSPDSHISRHDQN